jgi:hypothetical protein
MSPSPNSKLNKTLPLRDLSSKTNSQMTADWPQELVLLAKPFRKKGVIARAWRNKDH